MFLCVVFGTWVACIESYIKICLPVFGNVGKFGNKSKVKWRKNRRI